MKEGFIVENAYILNGDNCILVDNDIGSNIVYNLPLNENAIENNKDEDSIGVWKIKSLKN